MVDWSETRAIHRLYKDFVRDDKLYFLNELEDASGTVGYDTLRAARAAIFAVWEDNARAAAQLDSILTKKTKGIPLISTTKY